MKDYERGPIVRKSAKIIRLQDGKIFDSVKAVAEAMQCSTPAVFMHLARKTQSLRGWTYEKLEKKED